MKKEKVKNKDKIIIGSVVALLITIVAIITVIVLNGNKEIEKGIDLDYVFELKERKISGEVIKTKEFKNLEPLSTQSESAYEINTYKVNDGFNIVVFSSGENVVKVLLVNRASNESCDVFEDDIEYFLKYI